MKKVLAIFMVCVLFLAACGSNEAKKDKKDEGTKASADTRTIEHAMGKTEVPKDPKRIVILTNEGTEALVSMGVKPIGAVNPTESTEWFKHLADKYEGIEPVGSEMDLNLERIAKLKPDLIIGNKFRQEAQYDKLSAIAPTVFSEELRSDWKENFKVYANAVNQQAKGEEVLADYDKHIEDVKKELGDKTNQVISMVRFMPGDVRMYQLNSFSGNVLEQLGFKRPKSQNVDDLAARNLTKERIPEMDGDYLFYFTYMDGKKEVTDLEKEWLNDKAFKDLKVSKEGHVYKVDDAVWNTSGGVISANLMADQLKDYVLKK